MSNEPTLAELKSAVLEEWKGFQSDIKTKNEAEKDDIISSIISLSAETGQEIKKEELKDSNVTSLNILEKQLKNFLESRNSGDGGDPASGIVPRGDGPKTLTKMEMNNTIIDMITYSFGLPRPDSDKLKKGSKMTGPEYEELCEEVRMEHYGQGLRY